MKINFDYIDNEVAVSNEYILSLEIENRNYFYRIINDLNLISKNELVDSISFYNNDLKEINIINKINIVIDYFNLDFNTKKILNMVYKSVKDNIDEEMQIKISNYYNKIKNIISKSLIEYNLSLSINEEYDIDNIFKLLKISIDNKDNILDNLLLLIDLENTFKIDELLVLVNLKQYLSKDELEELYKYSLYNNVKILLIDSQSYGTTLDNEKKLIIDSNLEEILL